MSFRALHSSKKSKARVGDLRTAHGKVATPAFMPIATRGAVKTLTADEVKLLGADIILANTYHLFVRPGLDVIKKSGGLHKFMGWDGPILTDSGGYQVFSLASKSDLSPPRKRGSMDSRVRGNDSAEKDYDVRITRDGAEFIDRISGRKDMFTPERVLEIQRTLSSDIAMVLDVCAPYPVLKERAREAALLTKEWARRSIVAHESTPPLTPPPRGGEKSFSSPARGEVRRGGSSLLFGIVQGSVYKDLREQSAREITALNLDGYAIGGVAVGETARQKRQVVEWVVPHLPEDKPRYLMGLGQPEEIVHAVRQGIDMFDCVLPTRNARHGSLYVWKKRIFDIGYSRFVNKPISNIKYPISNFYQIIHITNEKYRADLRPPDPYCSCFTCTHHTRAYLRHLFKVSEPLALRLATIHNVKFYLELMEHLRESIVASRL